MVDTGQRFSAGTQSSLGRLGADRLDLALWGLLAGSLLFLLLAGFALPVFLFALAAAALLAGRPSYRHLALLIPLHTVLLSGYAWSLQESHHLTLTVTRSSMTMSVDGNAARLARGPMGDLLSFQRPSYTSYRVQATGEALQTDRASLLGRAGEAFRQAGPGPTFSHLIIRRQGEVVQRVPAPTGRMLTLPRLPFVATVDLLRPDGTAVLLAGVNRAQHGYAFLIRFDQPDAYWTYWDGGPVGALPGTELSRMPLVATLQRDLRLLLTPYLYALIFLLLALGIYPLLIAALARLGPPTPLPAWDLHVGWVWMLAALCGIAALIATASIATDLLERVPHVQDSVAYLFQAKIFALGHLSVPAPPAALQPFFSEEYVPFYHGRWFGQYPPGHPLVLALGVLLGAPWLVGPAESSLAIAALVLLARQVYGSGTALVAALLALTSPFWLLLGSSFMSHPTSLLLTVAFMLALARYERHPTGRWLALAGLFAGMSFIARPLTAVALMAPFALDLAWRCRHDLRALVPVVAGTLPPLAFLALFDWRLMGNPLTSTYVAWDPSTHIGFGGQVPIWGVFTLGDGLWNTSLNLEMLSAHALGWPYALALAPAFVPFLTGRAGRWDYLLLSSFLLLIAAYIAYWASGLMYGPRYYYEGLAALILLDARGLMVLWRLPWRCWPGIRMDAAASALFPALLLAALLLYALRFYWPAQLPLYHDYNYASGTELQAVQRQHPHHALVLVRPTYSYDWWSYGEVFFANNPTLRGSVIYARDLGPRDTILFHAFPGRRRFRLHSDQLIPIP